MKSLRFLLIAVCLMLFASVQAQITYRTLNSLDSSRLSSDSTLIVTKDLNADNGRWQWRKLPYSTLRDDIRDYDADPTGALMAEKFSKNFTLDLMDTAAYANTHYNTNWDVIKSSSFYPLSIYGERGSINFGWGDRIYMYSEERDPVIQMTAVNTPWDNNNDVWLGAYSYARDDSFNLVPNSPYFSLFRIFGRISDSTGVKNGFSMYFRTGSTHNQGSLSSEFIVETIKSNETTTQNSFMVNELGKWYGASYAAQDGYAKFEGGTLEQKTAVELLQEAAPNLSVYADNASAVSALGIGKMWRDASGFVRVTY